MDAKKEYIKEIIGVIIFLLSFLAVPLFPKETKILHEKFMTFLFYVIPCSIGLGIIISIVPIFYNKISDFISSILGFLSKLTIFCIFAIPFLLIFPGSEFIVIGVILYSIIHEL